MCDTKFDDLSIAPPLCQPMFFSSADQETLVPSGRLLTEREEVLPNMTESSVLLSVR